jgi:hypothetical protein
MRKAITRPRSHPPGSSRVSTLDLDASCDHDAVASPVFELVQGTDRETTESSLAAHTGPIVFKGRNSFERGTIPAATRADRACTQIRATFLISLSETLHTANRRAPLPWIVLYCRVAGQTSAAARGRRHVDVDAAGEGLEHCGLQCLIAFPPTQLFISHCSVLFGELSASVGSTSPAPRRYRLHRCVALARVPYGDPSPREAALR